MLSEAQAAASQAAQMLELNGNSLRLQTKTQCASFFKLHVPAGVAEAGICVQATSSSRSRFKLLHFDTSGQLLHQEDSHSSELQRGATEATMFFTPFDRYVYDKSATPKGMMKVFPRPRPPHLSVYLHVAEGLFRAGAALMALVPCLRCRGTLHLLRQVNALCSSGLSMCNILQRLLLMLSCWPSVMEPPRLVVMGVYCMPCACAQGCP